MTDDGQPVLSHEQIHALAAFRRKLREYFAFAESAAQSRGLTIRQHQALLAICASSGGHMTIGDLAEDLFLKHHTVVELVDRMEANGLVRRERSEVDRRLALIVLTDRGLEILHAMANHHLDELQQIGPGLASSLQRVLRRPRA